MSSIVHSETKIGTRRLNGGPSLFWVFGKKNLVNISIPSLFSKHMATYFILHKGNTVSTYCDGFDRTHVFKTFLERAVFHKTYGFDAALRQILKPWCFSPINFPVLGLLLLVR